MLLPASNEIPPSCLPRDAERDYYSDFARPNQAPHPTFHFFAACY